MVGGSVFPATLNLELALRALRRTESSKTLWVDAICINQANLQERGEQVRFMWQIYNNADCVIAWLGPKEGDSEIAMANFARRETQTRLAARATKREKPTGYSGSWCGCHAGDFATKPPRIGILNILGRQWFQRVWVLQEVAAAKRLVVSCGNSTVSGHDFYHEITGATGFHRTLSKVFLKPRPVVELMHQPSKLLQRQSLPLVALVEMFRSWLATDPLDKVYALLAFSSDAHDAAELQPDYTLSKYQLASKLIQYTFPACAVEQNCSNTDSATFKIEGLILGGINTKMSGGGKNKRTWHFRSPELSDLSAAPGMKLNATVSKLFQEPWEISVSNERKFQIGSFVCLLHGASLPTILRFHEGEYLVEMLAAPEPTRWIRKEKEQENWTEVMNILAMESDCTMDFKLTWDPFRQPLSSEVSLYTPTPYSFTTQWAALMEQFRESADPMSNGFGDRNENHDCHSMSNMWLQYRSELKHKVQSGEMKAGESKYIITIHHAAFRGHVGAIKVLVEANAEVDAQSEGEGAAPIHLASIYNHDLVVKALLEAKATVDIRDKEGRTALALAAKYGHLRIVEILLEAGASVDSRDITHGTTPLYAAIVGGFREIGGYLDVVKLLLKGNANANIADNQERLSPLHFAAESGNTQLAKELLDANAEVDARAKGGTTALHLAAQQNHLETVRVILDAGANVNAADDNGVTALHFACNFGHHEIVTELLLDESAEVNPETNSGGTPLDFAKDDPETVAALFSRLV